MHAAIPDHGQPLQRGFGQNEFGPRIGMLAVGTDERGHLRVHGMVRVAR